jgi:hypothetical protein
MIGLVLGMHALGGNLGQAEKGSSCIVMHVAPTLTLHRDTPCPALVRGIGFGHACMISLLLSFSFFLFFFAF